MRENDGLPRIVCMRCLGTLEFLCDFYERCHLTQKELLEASQNEENRKLLQQSDEESDKENAAPKVNEVKQKSKASPPNSSISTKNSLTESNRAEKNHSVTDITQSAAKSSSPLKKKILTKQSTLDNIVSKEKIPNNDRSTAGNLRHKKSLPASTEDDSKVLRTARSLSGLNSSLKNIDINSVLPVRRKRGRKSKLEKMREASLLASIKKEMNDDFDERRSGNFNDQGNRYGLRAIFSTAKSNNVTGNAVLSSKEHVEQIVPKKQAAVVNTSSNASHDKAKETNSEHRNDILAKKPRKVEFSSKSTDNSDNSSKSTEDDSEKSAGISIIIKQEKTETESVLPKQNEKCNKLVWIPNEILMEKGENLMKDQSLDKMDVEEIYSDMITSPDCNDQKSTIVTDQGSVTFTKSTESNDEIANLNTVEKDKKRLCNSDDEMTENSKIDLVYSVRGRSSLRRLTNSQDNFNESKSKDKSFGKISELISDEQKQAIETYYTVDMSVINEEEVQKNITIVDKKNVRCNICGILYIRMDKCLVHIWGHLQMKPYQCKTCDFSTVTVSNVRCHIRKSHLKIKPFACHLCEKRYLTSILLEEHINTHTGARPYKCKTCDFASSSRQILSYHNTTHKPVKDINCKICGKEFYSRNRLRSHMIIHNKDKVVACKFCSAYLSNAEALETHCRNLHTQDYVCNICGKRAKSRKALYNHMNVHAAAKYKCTLCPNVYKSSQILKEHILKHKGIRKYKCSVCEKSFGQQSHLAAHMAVHSKIRFHCPGCNKPFNRQDNMKIHTKRCKLFLANPELKSRLIKREKIISFDNITELTSELKARDMNKSMSCVRRQTDEAPIKTINDEDNASDCDSESESDICFNEPANKTLDHDRCQGADDILTSAELNVIKITNVADKLTTENRKFSVLENVLGPESY